MISKGGDFSKVASLIYNKKKQLNGGVLMAWKDVDTISRETGLKAHTLRNFIHEGSVRFSNVGSKYMIEEESLWGHIEKLEGTKSKKGRPSDK